MVGSINVCGCMCVCMCVYESLDYFTGCRKQLYLEIFYLRKKNIRLYERHMCLFMWVLRKRMKRLQNTKYWKELFLTHGIFIVLDLSMFSEYYLYKGKKNFARNKMRNWLVRKDRLKNWISRELFLRGWLVNQSKKLNVHLNSSGYENVFSIRGQQLLCH